MDRQLMAKLWDDAWNIGLWTASWRQSVDGLTPDSVLDKGTLAFMLRCVCELPRGVNEVVLVDGLGVGDRRYALKTCIYEGLMPYGQARDPVTGGEVVSALTAAEDNKSCQLASD